MLLKEKFMFTPTNILDELNSVRSTAYQSKELPQENAFSIDLIESSINAKRPTFWADSRISE